MTEKKTLQQLREQETLFTKQNSLSQRWWHFSGQDELVKAGSAHVLEHRIANFYHHKAGRQKGENDQK